MNLAPYATKNDSEYAKRDLPERYVSPYQNPFLVDAYRITQSPFFSRLGFKSQLSWNIDQPELRNRETHTTSAVLNGLEIAHGLRLNPYFIEASILGHDIGHTPFGHAGEKALRKLLNYDFSHEEQSDRILKYILKTNPTFGVSDAIVKHRGSKEGNVVHLTPESKVLKLADKIDNDINDFFDLRNLKISEWNQAPLEALSTLGATMDGLASNPVQTSEIMRNTIISSIIKNSEISEDKKSIDIKASEEVQNAQSTLHKFVYSIYENNGRFIERDKMALWATETLYDYFKKDTKAFRETDFHKYLYNKDPRSYKSYIEQASFDRQFCDTYAFFTDANVIKLCRNIKPNKSKQYFSNFSKSLEFTSMRRI